MPYRQCRKSSAIFLCGIMCLFLWQAGIYPVLGKGSDITASLPYNVAKVDKKNITNVNNSVYQSSDPETTKLVIKRGETLWDLARKYQTTVEELVNLNRLKSPHQIREGQSIWVPQPAIVKAEELQTINIKTLSEEDFKEPTEVKAAEKVSYTPWWLNILRNIPLFAAVNKPASKSENASDLKSSDQYFKIQTYEIYVDERAGPAERLSMNELTDLNDERSKIMGNKDVSIMTSENRIHSRGLGRFVTMEEVELLSRVIYGEARGEDFLGQVAVGAVVLNRLKDPRFPKTIRSIVYQSGAFTAVDDRQIHLNPDDQAYKAAEAALSGVDPTNGAIFYYNPRLATDRWIKSRPVIKKIGNHTFSI